MKRLNSIKWALVTFSGCVTCATVAHYIPEPMGPILTAMIAVVFCGIGALAVSHEQEEN